MKKIEYKTLLKEVLVNKREDIEQIILECTRTPAEYSVGEILEVAEGTLAPVACLMDDAEDCPRANQCRTLPMWKKFDSLVHDFFYNITLEQILEDPKFLPEE